MTVPTISNLPTVPATSDPNFETEAPALFNHIKNTFVSEMNSAISFINSSTFDATVEFKNANFTAARNFLYMIDTSSAAVSVTLPLNPSTGDQLLLMDQKRSFGTNNLTIGRNGQNINGAASNVVSKSTGALIRCIFQSSYGWTVDLYEGQWESGYTAGDLVYTGGNVGIGTTAPATTSNLEIMDSVNPTIRINRDDSTLGEGDIIGTFEFNQKDPSTPGAGVVGKIQSINESASIGKAGLSFSTGDQSTLTERVRIDADGNVGIGTSSPSGKLDVNTGVMSGDVKIGNFDNVNNGTGSNTHLTQGTKLEFIADTNPRYSNHNTNTVAFVKAEYDGSDSTADVRTGNTALTFATHSGFADTGTLSEKMRISSFGNVGIGTSSPNAKLEVESPSGAGNTNLLTLVRGGGYGQTTFNQFYNTGVSPNPTLYGLNFGLDVSSDTTGKVGIKFESTTSGQTSSDKIYFKTANTNQMVIDNVGRVGIGTSAPSGDLHIESDNLSTTQIIMKSTATGGKEYHFNCTANSSSIGGGKFAIRDFTANAYRMIIDSNVEVTTGNLVIGTAGKGIDFGVASGSVTSQLLDDYEEGTFTPKFTDNQSTPNQASGSFSGTYTKIGRLVTISCFGLNLNTSGMTSTDPLKIRDLPFVNESTLSRYGSVRLQDVSFSGYCNVQISVGVSVLEIMENISGSGTNVLSVADVTTVGNTADILLTLTYETS